ncbi:MAG TPA: hypothetical protein VHZ50_05345, partial [Puia sp.]|nr:hypothetical protein [Puia sp.]
MRRWYNNLTLTHRIGVLAIFITALTNLLVFGVYVYIACQNTKLIKATENLIKETHNEFVLSHQAKISLYECVVYRHWWSVHHKNGYSISFRIKNTSDDEITIININDKLIVDSIGAIFPFEKNGAFEVPIAWENDNDCTKEFYPSFQCPTR